MDWAMLRQRGRQYALLMRLDRPIGILLLLWPTLWALWIAGEGRPDGGVCAVFVLGVILMRSAGCVINDWADRDIDPHVERTRDRPLASGQVSSREALILFATLCLLAFGLVLFMNGLTVLLSLVAVVLAASYPFAKRYTYLPQAHLGMAFGWAVPMAFAAQTGSVPVVAWLLWITVVVWAVAYDTLYAMMDREDDIRIGVKSTAILFGDADRIIIGLLQLTVLLALLLVGQRAALGSWYITSLVLGAGLFAYQQYLIRERAGAACFRAFFNNNYFGAVVFFGLLLHYRL